MQMKNSKGVGPIFWTIDNFPSEPSQPHRRHRCNQNACNCCCSVIVTFAYFQLMIRAAAVIFHFKTPKSEIKRMFEITFCPNSLMKLKLPQWYN